jgi:hypothetical protein
MELDELYILALALPLLVISTLSIIPLPITDDKPNFTSYTIQDYLNKSNKSVINGSG